MAALRSGAHQVFVDDLLVRLDAEPRLLGQVRDAVADSDGAFGEATGDFTLKIAVGVVLPVWFLRVCDFGLR